LPEEDSQEDKLNISTSENAHFVDFYRRKLDEIIKFDREETDIDNEDKQLLM